MSKKNTIFTFFFCKEETELIMGGITSCQKDVDDTQIDGEVKALSMDMKTRFASVDPAVLGDYKDEAMAKLTFVYGHTANIFLIVTPPFEPAHHHEQAETHAETHAEHDGEAPQPPQQEAEDAEEKKKEEDPEEAKKKEAPEEAKKKEEVKEVRWTVFNDSKSAAKVEATFFHAEELRRAGSESSVKMERRDGGVVKAMVDVPAGATVAFVEGPIKGYMYKCLVYDPKTSNFELAASTK